MARLGDRVVRRPQPRLGIALAGVGVLMVILGVVVLGGDSAGDGSDGEVNRTVGVLLSMAVIAAGYLLLVRFRRGPLATAGVVAAALGVPMMLIFATVESGVDAEPEVFLTPPVSTDAVALLSLAAWLASYLWIPVARGRVFFLSLSTFMLWLYLMEKVEEGASGYLLTLPFSSFLFAFDPLFEESGGPQLPDPSSIGGLSLVIGLVYYVVAAVLDRRDRRGIATPFLAAGFVATGVGVGHLAADLEVIGTGVLLIILGAVLGVYGAIAGRRFTTWLWAGAAGFGILLIAGDAFEESTTGFGVAAMVLGAIVVLAAHLTVTFFGEPDEMAGGGSRFTPRRPGPQPGAGPAPAAQPGAWGPPGSAPPPGPPSWAPPVPPAPDPPAPPGPSAQAAPGAAESTLSPIPPVPPAPPAPPPGPPPLPPGPPGPPTG